MADAAVNDRDDDRAPGYARGDGNNRNTTEAWLTFPGMKCPTRRAFYPVMKRGASSPQLLLWDPAKKNAHWHARVLYWRDVPILRPTGVFVEEDDG